MISNETRTNYLSLTQTHLKQLSVGNQSTFTPEEIDQALQKVEKSGLIEESLQSAEREAIKNELIRRSSRTVGKSVILTDKRDHVHWLNSERKENWKYWNRYREYMETSIPINAVIALDETTDDILSQLEDPTREGSWDRRGLVVGHVQSGKTGNYTGLICKAADAGYKIIVVLAGLTNNLRAQTQIRLDEGFLGVDTTPNQHHRFVGVGEIDKDPGIIPQAATYRTETGDFTTRTANALNISPEQLPWLFVVKKNKTVLTKLLGWVKQRASNQTDQETGQVMRRSLPLLLIDDEADHGSVDTDEQIFDESGKPDLEHQPRTINRLIRKILLQFDRKAYVGYTATPFANIFIHNQGNTTDYGPDLFPSAFITSLAAPSNYVGPGRIFGTELNDSALLPVIQELAPDEYTSWMPLRHKNHSHPLWNGQNKIPPSLEQAVHSFIFACATRILRGQKAQHSSMLIHVTRFNSIQKLVTEQVQAYVRELKAAINHGVGRTEILALLKRQYQGTFRPEMKLIQNELTADDNQPTLNWMDLEAVLPDIVSDIDVRAINGSSGDVLDYSEQINSSGLRVIAIGGDKLARGLTLEGLCTSYFLRSARMYDTLMQMGRWFGYRDGYVDVCRLYTTTDLIEWFGHIAEAAEELRQELDIMVSIGATPKDFGLRVKSHSILTVTSPMKMRNARPMKLTYSGSLLQTVAFHNTIHENSMNFAATENFLKTLGKAYPLNKQRYVFGSTKWSGYFWRDVAALNVVSFLRDYKTHPASFRVLSGLIADFIEEMNKDGELINWTVALIGTQKSGKKPSRDVRIANYNIQMHVRKKSVHHDDRYSIKVLTSPIHQAIDLTKEEWNASLDFSRKNWKNDSARNESSSEPIFPRGAEIRAVLGKEAQRYKLKSRMDRGLLMIYLLDPVASDVVSLKDAPPIVGWAISFPSSNSLRVVSNEKYMANNVYWENFNDGMV